MQLAPRPTGARRPPHLAAALADAARGHGHRPALSVLQIGADGGVAREEQGFASLAQWAAKGAHLLEVDLFAEPGDRLLVDGPPGWMPAAVVLAAWWAGVEVVTSGDAEAVVVHEHRTPPDGDELFRWGGAADGQPLGSADGEPWAEAVQSFPDAPPPTRATADLLALDGNSQADLITAVHATATADGGGTAGMRVEPETPVATWLPLVVRALLTGRPAVLVIGDVPDTTITGDRVRVWLDADGA